MSVAKIGITIEEAAEMSGIGRNTMRALVDWGKLPVLKVGRKTIIRTDTLERFMNVNQGRNLRCRDDVKGWYDAYEKQSLKASPSESEIHPSHKPDGSYSGYFAPAEGLYRVFGKYPSHSIQRKMLRHFSIAAPLVTDHPRSGNCRMQLQKRTVMNHATAFVHRDEQAARSERTHQLYRKSGQTGKPVRRLRHR